MNQMKYSQAQLKKRIEELGRWYQNFNLNGILTHPEHPEYPECRWQLIEHYLPKDLTGKTVLDLGCNAGWFAMKMKERGADYVLGVDVSPTGIEQAKFISEYLGLSVDYKQINIYEFVSKNQRKFDFVLFLGLFYHLRYPLLVLDKMAEITRERLYFQTVIVGKPPITADNPDLPWEERKLVLADDFEDDEKKDFNHPDYPKTFFIEEKYGHDYSNWWFSNETCVYAMLRSAGFKSIIKSGADVFICDPPNPEYIKNKNEDFSYVVSRMPSIYSRKVQP